MGKSVVDIDKGALDEEWVIQPRRYRDWAKKLANARREVAEAKAALDVTTAVLALKIRKNPAAFGMKSVRENAIKTLVIVQKKHKRAVRRLNDAKHKEDLLEAVVKALEHRKKALEDLVTLHGQSYFASPRIKGEKGRELRERLEMAEKKEVYSRGRKNKNE